MELFQIVVYLWSGLAHTYKWLPSYTICLNWRSFPHFIFVYIIFFFKPVVISTWVSCISKNVYNLKTCRPITRKQSSIWLGLLSGQTNYLPLLSYECCIVLFRFDNHTQTLLIDSDSICVYYIRFIFIFYYISLSLCCKRRSYPCCVVFSCP